MDVVGNDYIDEQIAGDAVSSTSIGLGLLYHAKVDLFKEDLTPARDTPLADYTAAKCNYDGYVSDTITWNAPSRADDGTIEVVGTMPEFRPTGSATPNIAFGWYMTLSSGSLGFAGTFDGGPIPMGDNLDAVVLNLRYRPGNAALAVAVT